MNEVGLVSNQFLILDSRFLILANPKGVGV